MKQTIFKLFLLGILAATLSLTSCVAGKVSINPRADSSLSVEIGQGAKLSDSIYSAMLTGDKSFAPYAPAYATVTLMISDIRAKDSLRANNKTLIDEVNYLQVNYKRLVESHVSSGVLSPSQIVLYRAQLSGFWRPVIISELTFK